MSDDNAGVSNDVELAEEPIAPADEALQAHLEQLESRARSGANWFFWIAALSIVNTFLLLGAADRQFVIGLGITQLINAIALEAAKQAPETAGIAKGVAYVMTFLGAAFVAAFGLGARYRLSWIFIIGMALYALDGLLFLLFQDWFSVAFHVFALTGIYRGLSACRELKAHAAGTELDATNLAEPEPAA